VKRACSRRHRKLYHVDRETKARELFNGLSTEEAYLLADAIKRRALDAAEFDGIN
jgi:hypothetical protein